MEEKRINAEAEIEDKQIEKEAEKILDVVDKERSFYVIYRLSIIEDKYILKTKNNEDFCKEILANLDIEELKNNIEIEILKVAEK